MAAPFDLQWAEQSVAGLKARGVQFVDGLGSTDFEAIAVSFGAPVPPELEVLLTVGVPVSEKWARWVDGPEQVADDARRWIDRAFAFDIEHNDYWHPLLGERPPSLDAAIAQALQFVAGAPPLIPVYGHRFLTTTEAPRAVLSVWQAVDSIFYGNDLTDYLSREFGVDRPEWAGDEEPRVPVWEDLFDLWCVGRIE